MHFSKDAPAYVNDKDNAFPGSNGHCPRGVLIGVSIRGHTCLGVCTSLNSLAGLHAYVLGGRGYDEFRFGNGGLTTSQVAYDVPNRIVRNDPGVTEPFKDRFPGEVSRLASGEMLAFPAARTADNSKFAAAVVGAESYAPTQFVIRDGNAIHRVNSFAGFRIYSMAWSPHGNQLAVLQRSYDNSRRSLIDFLSPHGVQYSDILLTVFAPSGELKCQSVLVRSRPSAQSAMEWSTP